MTMEGNKVRKDSAREKRNMILKEEIYLQYLQ
jgi:hypothetical protein